MTLFQVTNIAVSLKSCQRLNIMPGNEGKNVEVFGLQFGPLVLSAEEARAVQQMLNALYPEETA